MCIFLNGNKNNLSSPSSGQVCMCAWAMHTVNLLAVPLWIWRPLQPWYGAWGKIKKTVLFFKKIFLKYEFRKWNSIACQCFFTCHLLCLNHPQPSLERRVWVHLWFCLSNKPLTNCPSFSLLCFKNAGCDFWGGNVQIVNFLSCFCKSGYVVHTVSLIGMNRGAQQNVPTNDLLFFVFVTVSEGTHDFLSCNVCTCHFQIWHLQMFFFLLEEENGERGGDWI